MAVFVARCSGGEESDGFLRDMFLEESNDGNSVILDQLVGILYSFKFNGWCSNLLA